MAVGAPLGSHRRGRSVEVLQYLSPQHFHIALLDKSTGDLGHQWHIAILRSQLVVIEGTQEEGFAHVLSLHFVADAG